MKQVAFINITLNAVGPMQNCLRAFPEIRPVQYLDGSISGKVAAGGITDECMGRMLSMIANACADHADGIVLTCTMFSPYVPYFNKLFSVPVVAADVAMMQQAAAVKGKKALLCTFASTKETSTALLRRCCDEAENEGIIDTFVLQDAFDRAAAGDIAGHNALIAEKLRELDGEYDQIVLAQMSMADAVPDPSIYRAQVFTSPRSACETILAL